MIQQIVNRAGDECTGRTPVSIAVSGNEDVVLAKARVIKPEEIRRAQLPGVADSDTAMLVLP